jgi:shikimate kinase
MKNSIFLIGPMGAGKSSIGKQLAKKLNCDFYDSDTLIEQRAGASISWIFDVESEAGMRDREEAVIAEITRDPNIVLATGGGSIMRETNQKNLSSNGTIVYLQASLEQQQLRTAHNLEKRPMLDTDDVGARIVELDKIRAPIYEKLSDIIVSTDDKPVTTVVKEIIHHLKENHIIS